MPRKLIILLLCLFILAACGGDDGEDGRTNEVLPTAVAQQSSVAATVAPPTDTPIPPTHTPVPTNTPEPTGTPQPTATLEPTATPVPLDNWTVLVYLDADNNLEEPGLLDINEMEAAGSSDEVNVLVQMDRIEGETDWDGDWTETRRFRMKGDDDLDFITSPVLEELGEVNMGDPATLTDFLVWGMTEYPAEHYAVVLWDHGAGWFGVAFDDTTIDGDGLTLPELTSAFEEALAQTGVEKFDIIGFDACLMGQLDVYFAMQAYGDYAVGSEELVPGLGWDYEAILRHLYEDPAMDGATWAEYLVSDFLNFYTKIEPDPFVTMSAVDLTALAEVATAMKGLSLALQTNPLFHASAIGDARNGAEGYALVYPDDAEYYAAIDLWHFANILAQRSPDEQVIAAANEVVTAVENSVIAAEHGNGFTYAKGIALYFPRTADYLASSYQSEAMLSDWSNFLTKFHTGLEEIPAPEFNILNILSSVAGIQKPAYLDVEIIGTDIQNVVLISGRYEENRQLLLQYDNLIPEPTYLEDGSLLYEWRDGVHQDFFVWTTESPYVYDSQGNGDYVVMAPTDYDSPLYTVQGRFQRAGADKFFEANLVFNTDTAQISGVWTFQGEAGSAPNEAIPAPGDTFQLYSTYINADGTSTFEPGITLTFDENGQLYYAWLPLPSGDYFLGFSAQTIAGETADAFTDFTVDNDNLVEGYAAYLDPYKGFQFLYPTTWYAPSYEGTQLYTYDIETGTTYLNITLYPEADNVTAETLKAQAMSDYGDLDYFFEDSVTIGGVDGLITGYRYEGDNGPHTGFFLTFVFEGTGYRVDVDGLQENEQETAEAVDAITTSWVFHPVGFGLQPGNWATVQLENFSVEVPSDFVYEETESGWQLFSAEDDYSFVALRTDPTSGDDLETVISEWVAVAAEGFDDFSSTEPYKFSLADKAWTRVDFAYTAEDGTEIWGLLMVTLEDDQEITAWAEAPADVYNDLESSIFLVTISDLTLGGEMAESTPTPEPTSEPSVNDYIETFDEVGNWATGSDNEVEADVLEGVYDFTILAEESLYWTTGGENFTDGVYEVEATAVDGALNNGFGMMFRYDEETDSFYLFEVSSDGYIWIGLCQNGCSEVDAVVEGGWFQSDAVNQGLNATNFLRVEAKGSNLAFYVNGIEVGRINDNTLTSGDIGLLVETFDEGGVRILFDNFLFTPGSGK